MDSAQRDVAASSSGSLAVPRISISRARQHPSFSSASVQFSEWEHQPTLAPFLKRNYDEAAYVTQAMLDSASNTAVILGKLDKVVQQIDAEIHAQVVSHHKDLLNQMGSIQQVEADLGAITKRLQSVQKSTGRINQGLLQPFNQLERLTNQMDHLQKTTDRLRSVERVQTLVEKLRVLMKHAESQEKASSGTDASKSKKDSNPSENLRGSVSKAALHLAELEALQSDGSLRGITLVQDHQAFIATCRNTVSHQIAQLVAEGLSAFNMAQLGDSLQIAFNLGPAYLYETVNGALDKIVARILKTFNDMVDVSTIGDQTAPNGSTKQPGRAKRATSGSGQAGSGHFRAVLWDRLETVVHDLFNATCQVWTLAQVLSKKQDSLTQTGFLGVYAEELSKTGKGSANLIKSFWASMCSAIKEQLISGSKRSSFVRSVFINELPRLSDSFSSLFVRVEDHLASSPLPQLQSNSPAFRSPWSVSLERMRMINNALADLSEPFGMLDRGLLMASIGTFRAAFLNHCVASLNEPVKMMFSSRSISIPSPSDVEKLCKEVYSKLTLVSSSHEDLQLAICTSISQVIKVFVSNCDNLHATEGDTHIFPSYGSQPSVAQRTNSDLFMSVRVLAEALYPNTLNAILKTKLLPSAAALTDKSWQLLDRLINRVFVSLLRSAKDQFLETMGTMLKDDYGGSSQVAPNGSSTIVALRQQIAYFVNPLLGKYKYSAADEVANLKGIPTLTEMSASQWMHFKLLALLAYLTEGLAHGFVVYATTLCPLHKRGKEKLVVDTTQLVQLLATIITPKNRRLLAATIKRNTSPQTEKRLFDLIGFGKGRPSDDGGGYAVLSTLKGMLFTEDIKTFATGAQLDQRADLEWTQVMLTQYLLSGCGLSNPAPHSQLQMRPRDYERWVEDCVNKRGDEGPERFYSRMRVVYEKLEKQIKIPAGPAGKDYIANKYPMLHLVLQIVPKP